MIARELRRGLLITQSDVSFNAGLSQSAVEKIESSRLDELPLEDLKRYVEGLGGRLEIVVPAPHGTERRVAL